ncbi:MAG: DUF3572 family protein, partial [Acidimicrobiales bacterium]
LDEARLATLLSGGLRHRDWANRAIRRLGRTLRADSGYRRRTATIRVVEFCRASSFMSKAVSRMTAEDSESLAVDCLAFLAARPGDFERFAELSGLEPATVRSRVGERDFLASVLDFVLANEGLLVSFCEDRSTDARNLHVARHALG